MSGKTITMSHAVIDRLSIIESTIHRHITQSAAAKQLKLSVRQVKRLVSNYQLEGPQGLVSKRRGKPSNNRIANSIRLEALALIRCRYSDFSPTFAHEKLTECHQLSFSVETLRHWMIDDSIWHPKRRKKTKTHPERPRRPRLGELVQIDGSPHDWFEGRSASCTLIVFIDDATGRLMSLRFSPTETTQAYMKALDTYLSHFGRPAALYSDKHSIFRVNHVDHESELTQFTRALKTLNIEPIHANTPQAKGRVERANKTLQDRLVKEMRLNGINTIDEANRYLPIFMEDYNRRFCVPAHHPQDAHRPVLHSEEELKQIFTLHHARKLTKNLTLQFRSTQYQLQGYGHGYRLRGAKVTICEAFTGEVTLLHKGNILTYRKLTKGEKPIALENEKTVRPLVDLVIAQQQQKPQWKPAVDHPWKRS
jgi:hypothetical protein